MPPKRTPIQKRLSDSLCVASASARQAALAAGDDNDDNNDQSRTSGAESGAKHVPIARHQSAPLRGQRRAVGPTSKVSDALVAPAVASLMLSAGKGAGCRTADLMHIDHQQQLGRHAQMQRGPAPAAGNQLCATQASLSVNGAGNSRNNSIYSAYGKSPAFPTIVCYTPARLPTAHASNMSRLCPAERSSAKKLKTHHSLSPSLLTTQQ